MEQTSRTILRPRNQALSITLFPDATFCQKSPVLIVNQATKQSQGLVDNYQCYIGYVLVGTALNLPYVIRTVVMFTEEGLASLVLIMSNTSGFQLVIAQIVLIVFLELLQTALGDDRELMFHLSRAFCIAVAFHNILFS